jgi:hypothetical protein
VNEPRAECQQGNEEKIRRLELASHPLDPGPKERAILRDKAVAYADSFMERINGRPAFAVSEGEDGEIRPLLQWRTSCLESYPHGGCHWCAHSTAAATRVQQVTSSQPNASTASDP